jgi:RNA polymerase sigma-70 factor (ECF subfamily)
MHYNSNTSREGEIVERIIEGDVNAFEYLLDRYRSLVFAIVMKHIPRNQVEEVAHDIFIRAYQSLPTYKHKSDLKYWLSKIAVRACYDYWRKEYRSRERPFSDLTEDQLKWVERVTLDQSNQSGENERSQHEAQELLEWAMNQLSAKERILLELIHIEELPVKEVAGLLGWSVANVKVRAFRSRKKLRKALEKLLDEQGEKK